MGFLSVLGQAQRLVTDRLGPGDTAIDATAGNGVDTLFLAKAVGPKGRVYAFDVQEEALRRTKSRLDEAAAEGALAPVSLVLDGHENMKVHIPPERHGRISAAMFNLGYLPGLPDEAPVVTLPSTTIAALDASLTLLAPGGVICAVVYPGHEGGQAEADAVLAWAAAVPSVMAQSVLYRYVQKPAAPFLVALSKR